MPQSAHQRLLCTIGHHVLQSARQRALWATECPMELGALCSRVPTRGSDVSPSARLRSPFMRYCGFGFLRAHFISKFLKSQIGGRKHWLEDGFHTGACGS